MALSRQQNDMLLAPVGGVVMRIQVDTPSDGHDKLLKWVADRHKDVLVFLGYTGGMPTECDPLTFDMRAAMLRQNYPYHNLNIQAIMDNPIGPEFWSEDLDLMVHNLVPEHRSVLFYTGRDGFNREYTGSWEVIEIPSEDTPSGTAIRNDTIFPHSKEGRQALVAFHRRRPGFMYSSVDIGTLIVETDEIIQIGKRHHGEYRTFPGGHVEKKDKSLEDAADREDNEETPGKQATPAIQVRSLIIDDPRYRRSKKDGMVTTVCARKYLSGMPIAKDDADTVHRTHRSELIKVTAPWHRPIAQLFLDNWDDIVRRIG